MTFSSFAFGLCGLILLTSACDTPHRTWTTIQVTTDPPGAHCELIRGNLNLHGFDTPGKVRLDGSRQSTVFVCAKDGFKDSIFVLRPITHSFSMKNLVLPMGGVISATSGKDNTYDETVSITLERSDESR
ncbi:hypothetical protein [Magnetospirillum fulvum]|uniref:Secreted protein n=1 Tax=Magnetospirillum fulvum MGU-K5 TaxID=1316936 RepID=S9TJS1_MAGFU|nr:hypothetical protein [Magnetospirillum fulvum]EPY02526.1 hypothetical protein K678_05503 [Magnetospirillum fulvum MGU-K5]